MWVYTELAEHDNVGNAGERAEHSKYLELHGYIEEAKTSKRTKRNVGALAKSPNDGAIKRKRKTKAR